MKVSVKQITTALNVSQQAVCKRLIGLPHERDKGRSHAKLYAVATLPSDIQEAVAAASIQSSSPVAGSESLAAVLPGGNTGLSSSTPAALQDWQRRRAEARAGLIAEVRRVAQDIGVIRALNLVAKLATQGELSAGVSVTYAPINPGSETSGTLYFYVGGKLFKALYCLGNVEAVLQRGKIPFWHFTFIGIYAAVSDAALAAPTLTAFKQPLLVTNANTTPVTLATYSIKLLEFRLATGNVLTYRNLVNSEAVRFVDRTPTSSVKFEEELVATKDFYALARAGTLSVMTATHGTVAGSKVTIAENQAQLDAPTLDQDNNLAIMGLTLRPTPTSAGNNEFSFVFT